MSTLVTGEAVPLEIRTAKAPSRSVSFLLDGLVIGLLAFGVILLVQNIVGALDAAAAAALVLGTVVLLIVGVPTTIETLTRGRSIGKFALGLRVVRDDGGPIRFRHALVRSLFGVVDFLLTFGCGALICSLLNERAKRIGDFAAGTMVVRIRTVDTTAPMPEVPANLQQWATGLEMSNLEPMLANSARSYLLRAHEMSPQVRESMGHRLATQVAQSVSPAAPLGTPAWAYLAAVLQERSRREAIRMQARDSGTPVSSGHVSSGHASSGHASSGHASTGHSPAPHHEPPPASSDGFTPPA